MKYSVKDLSNILGITTSAIHFFEKENLIKANKEKNGWRYDWEFPIIKVVENIIGFSGNVTKVEVRVN